MASNKIMIWTDAHDVVLGRQVVVIRPYRHRKGPKESANGWNEITQYLQGYAELSFCVSSKSVRDHLKHLVTKRKRVISQEKRASGIDVELSEIDILLDEIIDDSEAAQETLKIQSDVEKTAAEMEKLEAEEMRKTSMESMGETRKRRAESEGLVSPKQSRSNGTETIQYLRAKTEERKQQHEEELALRKKGVKKERKRRRKKKFTYKYDVANDASTKPTVANANAKPDANAAAANGTAK